jgi:hypothetical protein
LSRGVQEPNLAQFNGKIGPGNLLGLVTNTAPFIFEPGFVPESSPLPARNGAVRPIEMAAHPYGWLEILLNATSIEAAHNPTTEQREDYFALCLACHHATVATFVPTDVDAKIRGQLWQQREDPQALRRMFEFVLHAMKWDISRISTRATELSGVGPVSGHNGEMLGVLAGALGGFLKSGDGEFADKAAVAIDAELQREAHEFLFVLERVNAGAALELDLLRLAISLTHNAGDLDQGISFWSGRDIYAPHRARFHRLAHENTEGYGRAFHIAAHLYKRILSSEGHRHYPLREVRALRSSPEFLLPLGPFFDDWGALLGSHPKLSVDDRAEALAALLSGCRKIANQLGYFRAVAGMTGALGGKLDKVVKRMPASLRNELKESEVRKHMAVRKISFESGMRKRCRAEMGTALSSGKFAGRSK